MTSDADPLKPAAAREGEPERALEALQAERAIDRMRLLECLRLLERDSPEAAALFERVPELERQLEEARAAASSREQALAAQRASILRLESILAEDGHRVAARLGEWQQRHPAIGKVLSAVTGMLRRLLDRP